MSVTSFTSSSDPKERHSANNSSNGRSATAVQNTIYLSPVQNQSIDGLLGYLVRVFHLDIYGTSLMTRSVFYELKAISLALAIMFTFDLAAWTFFWNMVLYNGQMTLGLFTPFAVLFGLMFSLIIVIYERQWVVTDTSRLGQEVKASVKIFSALLLRAFIIALAAYATAQPIEVLFFNGQIQKRVHDESVRSQAIAQFRDYQEKVRKAQGADPSNQGKLVYKEADDAQNRLLEKQAEKGTLQAEMTNAGQKVQAAEKNLSYAQSWRTKNSQARANRIARAQQKLNDARNKAQEAQNKVGANAGVIEGAEQAVKRTSDERKGDEKLAETQKQRIVNWIKQLRSSNPGDTIVENTTEPNPITFEDKKYDFFERMTIIDDLINGQPPKWVGADIKEVEDLKKEFAFGDSADIERRKEDAKSFFRQWMGLLVITLIFPLSVIAMKFLMSVDKSLMNYYSHQEQMQNTDYAVHLYSYHQTKKAGTEEKPVENGHYNQHHQN